MTTTQNSLLGRTRSARLNAANSSKAIAATPTEGPAFSRQSTALAMPSNVSLFLTNLRLLDLDLLPDWPDINPLTFTNKDVAQGQKKRIQCVEWALYQLFSLWDPEMASNKLQPFFPPFDQVQSQNLRAALLRCLERAKKSGVLGRDAILRKSMLDECKGERLEEILAVFSSAILKKVVAEEQLHSNRHPVVAQTLALENRGYSGGRDELETLILAHKVSLTLKLTQKKAAKAQYQDFAELLDMKERSIVRRREQMQTGAGQSKVPRLSEKAKLDVRRVVRNNWSGNERWMEALLYGDAKSPRDGLLTAPFDRVWRRLQSNRLSELEDKTGGLLEQLDSRVRAQQKRLGKWQTFRQEMFGSDEVEAQNKADEDLGRYQGIDLEFGAHESLHPGRSSPRKLTEVKAPGIDGEYGKLLEDLDSELKDLGRGSYRYASGHTRRREEPLQYFTQSPPNEKAVDEPVSELSELEEESAKAYAPPPNRHLDPSLLDSEATLDKSQRPARARPPQPLTTMHAFRPNSKSMEICPTEPHKPTSPPRPKVSSPQRSPVREYEEPPPSSTRSLTRSSPRSRQRTTSRSPASSPPRGSLHLTQSPEPMPPSPTQQQADQILESMNTASPSPIKQPRPRHTLSLAERTRLSLDRTLSTGDADELAMGTPMPLRRRTTTSRSPPKRSKTSTINTIPEDAGLVDNEDDKAAAEEDDLVARTRKSMANFEATQQRIRLERQRLEKQESKKNRLSNRSGEISRQSYFSGEVDDEAEGGEGNSTMMLEELIAKEAAMGQGVDYDSIFKSRPRIKASPPGTPVRDHFA